MGFALGFVFDLASVSLGVALLFWCFGFVDLGLLGLLV